MLKEIVIFSIMLCPAAENNTCMKTEQSVENTKGNYNFVTAMTPWQKVEEKTIYFDRVIKLKKR